MKKEAGGGEGGVDPSRKGNPFSPLRQRRQKSLDNLRSETSSTLETTTAVFDLPRSHLEVRKRVCCSLAGRSQLNPWARQHFIAIDEGNQNHETCRAFCCQSRCCCLSSRDALLSVRIHRRRRTGQGELPHDSSDCLCYRRRLRRRLSTGGSSRVNPTRLSLCYGACW